MKYKLTTNTKNFLGKTLFQIEATISFGSVSKGELGGYIEKEENLDQSGDAWVSGNALVYGNARVSGDALVYGNARVSGDALVYGNAWVSGNALVYGNAWVYGNARVSGDAWVSGDARVYGKLKLSLGYFFGRRDNKEEIKFVKVDYTTELIYKGEAKIETDEIPKEIEQNGRKYRIVE